MEGGGDDLGGGDGAATPEPPHRPKSRPATAKEVSDFENVLRDQLIRTAHAWRQHAYTAPSLEHREIASVLMALLTSSGMGVGSYGQNPAGEWIRWPNPTARKWRKDAANAAWNVVRDPVLADNLEAQVLQIEWSITDGSEREAARVLDFIASSPAGSRIRAHAPKLQSAGIHITRLGLQQKLQPMDAPALVQAICEAWAKRQRSPQWSDMGLSAQRRALVLAAFRALGDRKPGNLYAGSGMKNTRKHRGRKRKPLRLTNQKR